MVYRPVLSLYWLPIFSWLPRRYGPRQAGFAWSSIFILSFIFQKTIYHHSGEAPPPPLACALEHRVQLLPVRGGARTLLLGPRSTLPPKSYASLYVSEQPHLKSPREKLITGEVHVVNAHTPTRYASPWRRVPTSRTTGSSRSFSACWRPAPPVAILWCVKIFKCVRGSRGSDREAMRETWGAACVGGWWS